MAVKARTWTLDGYSEKFRPSIAMDKTVEVIEKAPVLDLLERAYKKLPPVRSVHDSERAEIAALLREHGRLVGHPDKREG